jgi:hypothetical protein
MTAHVRGQAEKPGPFSFSLKKSIKSFVVVVARGYVGNPKGCPSPVVNPSGFSIGRHIHEPAWAVRLEQREPGHGFYNPEKEG